jgi:hypothetical protein
MAGTSDRCLHGTTNDGVENSLQTMVCAEQMTLAAAQAAIANDWESA